MRHLSERALVTAARRGEADAFDELLRRHQEAVYRVALGFTGARDAALDVAQLVFLKAWTNLAAFREEASVRTWLLRIAANESLTWLKRRSREAPRSLDLDVVADVAATGTDAERALIAKDNAARLHCLIAHLGERQRTAIVLRYFEGSSIDEIAAAIGSSADVVRNALYRAHQKLYALWRERHELP
jgi:RNA polymerase sigma-70 factor, ECF subfamily